VQRFDRGKAAAASGLARAFLAATDPAGAVSIAEFAGILTGAAEALGIFGRSFETSNPIGQRLAAAARAAGDALLAPFEDDTPTTRPHRRAERIKP
jgi:hypothetical protein